MPLLDLDHLDPHPGNANRMNAELFARLKAHIDRHGDYPPLIVRRHPSHPDRFQILDGHHRAKALRELGFEHAQCAIWEVPDDRRAAMLLLTLNRLHGEDDPQRRGELIAESLGPAGIADLARWLPEPAERIAALLRLVEPPEPALAMASPPDVVQMPRAVTFFITEAQRIRLFRRLRDVAADRSEALVIAMNLNDDNADNAASSPGVASSLDQVE